MIEDKKIVFTTSWDDGSKFDIKLKDILSKYGARGTFYVPKAHALRSLSDADVRHLAEEQEIGAHTLTHPK